MKMKITAIAFTALVLITSACKTKTKQELILGKWGDKSKTVIDEYRSNGTYVETYPNTSDPADHGKWRIKGEDLFLTVPGVDGETQFKISKLTEDEMVLVLGKFLKVTYYRAD